MPNHPSSSIHPQFPLPFAKQQPIARRLNFDGLKSLLREEEKCGRGERLTVLFNVFISPHSRIPRVDVMLAEILGRRGGAILTLTNPISAAFSRKHCLQMLRPYFRITPALWVHTRL